MTLEMPQQERDAVAGLVVYYLCHDVGLFGRSEPDEMLQLRSKS